MLYKQPCWTWEEDLDSGMTQVIADIRLKFQETNDQTLWHQFEVMLDIIMTKAKLAGSLNDHVALTDFVRPVQHAYTEKITGQDWKMRKDIIDSFAHRTANYHTGQQILKSICDIIYIV